MAFTRCSVALRLLSMAGIGLAVLACSRKPETQAPSCAMVVKQACDAVNQSHVGDLWQLAPRSYRSDVVGLLRQIDPRFAADMIDVATRLRNVLRDRQESVLATPMFANPAIDPGQNKHCLQAVISPLDIVSGIRAEAAPTADESDVEEFLETHGASLLSCIGGFIPDGVAQPAQIQVEPTDEGPGWVVARLIMQDETYTDIKMVTIDGTWVPEDIQRQWPEWINLLRQKIEDLHVDRNVFLPRVQSAVEHMEKATAQDEFDRGWHELMDVILDAVGT